MFDNYVILIDRKEIAFVNIIVTILSGHCVTPSPQLWRGQDGYNMLIPFTTMRFREMFRLRST